MEFWIIAIIIFGAAAFVAVQRHQQRKLLQRISNMVEQAKNGRLQPETIDESMISSVENDIMQFLQTCTVSEEKLEEQKNEIQTLISDISHQTTTPLSNIMIYSQLLEERLAGTEGQAEASIVRSQAEKLDFLVKSLVKASRLETGIITVAPKPYDLTLLLEQTVRQGAAKSLEKGIKLVYNRQEEPVFAMCDPKWTAEACYNLLDNAIKYTSSGGKVEISVTAYSLFVRIDIRDTGMGISEDEIPKIFGRFYRSTEAAAQEGVGLGLYLARQITEAQGGYIKVTSKPGSGSCFSVFLPEAGNLSEL